MRFVLAVAVLLSPATVYAQAEGPTVPIPVHRCVQRAAGVTCSPVRDGDGLAAADGYRRAHMSEYSTPSRTAMIDKRTPADGLTR